MRIEPEVAISVRRAPRAPVRVRGGRGHVAPQVGRGPRRRDRPRVTRLGHRLSRSAWGEIRERFGPALCLDDEDAFVAARGNRRFATLLQIAELRPLRPLAVAKRDRRGWVVLRSAHAIPWLSGLEACGASNGVAAPEQGGIGRV